MIDRSRGNWAPFPPDSDGFVESGRFTRSDLGGLTFHYAGSQIRFRTTSRHLALDVENSSDRRGLISFGVRVDDSPEMVVPIPRGRNLVPAAIGLPPGEKEIQLYRRSDNWDGPATVHQILLDSPKALLASPPRRMRRMECYGDSVTAGGGSDAVGYEGMSDSEVGLWGAEDLANNGYHSYAAMAARTLGAEAHLLGIGGLAVLDGTGYHDGPENMLGWETTWDKISPLREGLQPWDFQQFRPHLVTIALGQNDSSTLAPGDEPVPDRWKVRFREILEKLLAVHPDAAFLLFTTVLCHDLKWDRAIAEIVGEVSQAHDGRQVEFLAFQRAGSGTPGHPRFAEHEEMASELVAHIESMHLPW
jgi:hypothetical protein